MMNSHLRDGTGLLQSCATITILFMASPSHFSGKINHLCPSLLKKTPNQSQSFCKQEKQHFLRALQCGFLRMLKDNILLEIVAKGNLEVNLHFYSFRKKSLKDNLSSCNN